MQRPRRLEPTSSPDGDRGAGYPAPRSTPLTIVSGAVAGDDLERIARSTADELGCAVVITLPGVAEPAVWPSGSIAEAQLSAITQYAQSLVADGTAAAPRALGDAVPVQIAEKAVGVVAAVDGGEGHPERRVWLEAAAAAAAVTALMREDPGDRAARALLLELGSAIQGQEETYRLLIGVLLRDRQELAQLRDSTVFALAAYDERHDTDLVPTLHNFLAHHGSTSETAEAMSLHRHTVGYRLARVHEVSGLSPYETEGRERLSLGLKADQILAAHQRLSNSG